MCKALNSIPSIAGTEQESKGHWEDVRLRLVGGEGASYKGSGA